MVATRMPQLVELVRVRHARGVSTASWLLGSLSVSMWLCYYAASSMTAAAASMGLALVANLAIVALALYRHRTARIDAVAAHPGAAFALA